MKINTAFKCPYCHVQSIVKDTETNKITCLNCNHSWDIAYKVKVPPPPPPPPQPSIWKMKRGYKLTTIQKIELLAFAGFAFFAAFGITYWLLNLLP